MLPIGPIPAGFLNPADFASPEALRERQAFKQMEQVFLHTLLKEMRRTIPDGGLFRKTNDTRIFEDMLDEVFAQKMAESGQLGVAEAMEAQYTATEAAREARKPPEIGAFSGLVK